MTIVAARGVIAGLTFRGVVRRRSRLAAIGVFGAWSGGVATLAAVALRADLLGVLACVAVWWLATRFAQSEVATLHHGDVFVDDHGLHGSTGRIRFGDIRAAWIDRDDGRKVYLSVDHGFAASLVADTDWGIELVLESPSEAQQLLRALSRSDDETLVLRARALPVPPPDPMVVFLSIAITHNPAFGIALFITWLVLFALVDRRVVLGSDGVSIAGPGRRSHFVPLSKMKSLYVTGRTLSVTLSDRTVNVRTSGGAVAREAMLSFVQRVREGRRISDGEKQHSRVLPVPERLFDLVTHQQDYRSEYTDDALWEALVDDDAPVRVRVAAAVLIAQSGDGLTRERLRVYAHGSAVEGMKPLVDKALSGEDDDLEKLLHRFDRVGD